MKGDCLSARFAALFERHPLQRLMRNVRAHSETLTLNGLSLPCTVLDRVVTPNCYTVSPYAALAGYARDELVKLPHWQRWPLNGLLGALGAGLRNTQIDRVATLNNYCLSTNLLSPAFQHSDMAALTDAAVGRYPQHALLMRSLNRRQHAPLLDALEKQGWQMIVSRQVYLLNNRPAALRSRDSLRDQKLLDDGRYTLRTLAADAPAQDFAAAEHWYNRLYLEKYSYQNVQFTAFGLREMVRAGVLDLWLLCRREDGCAVGTVGMVCGDSAASAPIIGYDTAAAAKEGLYRRLFAHTVRESLQRNLWQNLSAGAPQFKRLRGAEAELEYIAVYTAHLPPPRRRLWNLLAGRASRYYAHLLQTYEL